MRQPISSALAETLQEKVWDINKLEIFFLMFIQQTQLQVGWGTWKMELMWKILQIAFFCLAYAVGSQSTCARGKWEELIFTRKATNHTRGVFLGYLYFLGGKGGTQVTRYGLMVAKHKIFFVIVMQINLWETFSCEVVPLWSFAKNGGIPHLGEDFMDGWQN